MWEPNTNNGPNFLSTITSCDKIDSYLLLIWGLNNHSYYAHNNILK